MPIATAFKDRTVAGLPGNHAFDGYRCRAFVTRNDSSSVCNAANTTLHE